jgi:hypothetical protein
MAERDDRGQRGDPDRGRGVRRAFAGGWAVASYLDLGIYGEHIVQASSSSAASP